MKFRYYIALLAALGGIAFGVTSRGQTFASDAPLPPPISVGNGD